MKQILFNLISAYVYHTPPHPGRGILARLAYWLYPNDIVAEIVPGIKIKVRLDSDQDLSYWTHQHERHDESEVFLSYLQEGMTVMDIGANVGVYALRFARKVGPNGKVYAFEPVPEIFTRLQENITLNNTSNIIPVPIALSDRSGKAKMSVAEGLSSLFHHLTNQFVEVRLMTLDEFISEHQIDRVDAIKLDVEGAELQVIRGADQTIRHFKPVMMVEINATTLKSSGTTPEELFQTIVNYGYKGHVIRNGKLIPTTKVIRPMGYRSRFVVKWKLIRLECDNYLFLPQEA